MSPRVGIGFDVHGLVEGRRLVLGGVEIPFTKGLRGWSDGDAPVHAVIDALLGAAALADIGRHFPPGDPAYKDISSLELLRTAGNLLQAHGWRIGNLDVTIVAQEPSLAPHVDLMRERIAGSLAINRLQVSVKAKTTDGLGVMGRGEGIAAYAVALVRESNEDS